MFHTASPIHGLQDYKYRKVNVEGTRTLLNACRHASLLAPVQKLVYTSSTGVVWNVKNFNGVSEDQVEAPKAGYDAYHHTKAIAENMVLKANDSGVNGFRTTALRPCGMTGYVLIALTY